MRNNYQNSKSGKVPLLYENSLKSAGNTELFNAGMVIDEQQFRLCFEEFHSILTNEKGQFLLKRLPSTRLVESSGTMDI